jgi:N-acetylmuramoyl-L-alanine amidase
MKAALIPGHGPNIDRGAVNSDGTTELDWNRDLVNRIASHLPEQHIIVNRTVERISPISAINATRADLAIEFHLNAATGAATGTEMIYWPSSVGGKKLALALQRAAVDVLKLKDRGIKEPWEGRGAAFLRGTRMPAVIAESFFIDNSSDLRRGNEVKEELAKAYAEVIKSFFCTCE